MKLPPASRGKAAAGLSLRARVLEEEDWRGMGVGWGQQAGSLRMVSGGSSQSWKYASEMLGSLLVYAWGRSSSREGRG